LFFGGAVCDRSTRAIHSGPGVSPPMAAEVARRRKTKRIDGLITQLYKQATPTGFGLRAVNGLERGSEEQSLVEDM